MTTSVPSPARGRLTTRAGFLVAAMVSLMADAVPVYSHKVTTAYNDFPNLKWLGSRQASTPIFSAAESGRWVCFESHVKLNRPGKRDEVFELWIDGRLEAARNDQLIIPRSLLNSAQSNTGY